MLGAVSCGDDGGEDAGDGDEPETATTTTASGGTSTPGGDEPDGSDSGLDIVEVDVMATPDEHEDVIATAAGVTEQWFTTAWEPRSHSEADDWIDELGHPDEDYAEALLTGPTHRSDDPGEVQAAGYWADIRSVLWNGADAPEDRRWIDDIPGSEIHFAVAVGRADVPALIARDDSGDLVWVRLPVTVEAGSTIIAPDGTPVHLRYVIQGDLELRPLTPEDETRLAITWLDADVDEERLNGLRIDYEDSPPTDPIEIET